MGGEDTGVNKEGFYARLALTLAIGSIICVVILSLRINGIDGAAHDALSLSEKALIDVQGVMESHNDIDQRLDLASLQFLGIRQMMFDLWLDGLNATAKGRIGNYELIHAGYFGCVANTKDVEGVVIVRNLWYDDEPLPAKAVIIEYDNHYLTYKNDGIIQCFPNPLLDYDVPQEPCENFCREV